MTNRFVFLDIDSVMKPGRRYFCENRTADRNGRFDPLAVAAANRLM